MWPSRILAVDHVHRQAGLGLEGEIRWFYSTVACLDEAAVGVSSRLLFRSGRIELRIDLSESPQVESAGFPVVVAAPALEKAMGCLADKSWPFERLTSTTWADRRIGLLDPAGNRVELCQEWPFGLI